jgi:hypothetical protein
VKCESRKRQLKYQIYSITLFFWCIPLFKDGQDRKLPVIIPAKMTIPFPGQLKWVHRATEIAILGEVTPAHNILLQGSLESKKIQSCSVQGG